MANFVVIGTWDTKHEELEFICEEIRKRSHHPIKLNLSTRQITGTRDVAISHKISPCENKIKANC